MIVYTIDEEDDKHPTPDGCVRAKFFKLGFYTQEGPDVHFHEAQSFDLNGYFPKTLMNKLQATVLLDNAKATQKIMSDVKK